MKTRSFALLSGAYLVFGMYLNGSKTRSFGNDRSENEVALFPGRWSLALVPGRRSQPEQTTFRMELDGS